MRLYFLCLLFPAFLTAQPAFLKDPDIVWAAQLDQDWKIDFTSLEDEYNVGITTIKWLRTDPNNLDRFIPKSGRNGLSGRKKWSITHF